VPCQAENPSKHESEMNRVCQLLLYVQSKNPGMILPNWVRKNAHDCYPDTSKLNHATSTLCDVCTMMSDHDKAWIIYNGREREARRLADWWEEHQEVYIKKRQWARALARQNKLRAQALAKLTPEEREAVNLKDPSK